ncbi:MAG: thioesterase family protein [Pseudomonadota bacterium]
MNLYWRLLLALWSGARAERLPHDALFIKRFRVWPHDLDAFGHMNNGRYLQIMDVARAEWMVRTGVFSEMRKHRWTALLGGGMNRFRRHLKLGQRYEVRTHLICWDQRWFYFEHRFVDAQTRVIAVGFSQAALRDVRGWVGADRVADAVAPGASSPRMPAYLAQWLQADAAMCCPTERATESNPVVEVAL